MDNHKDFIHIDDLFKDLRNGEEPEGSGAWLRMKDLLDKEMPVGTPLASGWSFRRYMLPLVALLLIGGGAAYYEMKDPGTVLSTGNPDAITHSSSTTVQDKNTGLSGSGHTGAQPVAYHESSQPGGNNGSSGNSSVAAAAHNPASNGKDEPGVHRSGAEKADHSITRTANASAAGTITREANKPGYTGRAGKNVVAVNARGKKQEPVIALANTLSEEEHVIEKIRPGARSGSRAADNDHNMASVTERAGKNATADRPVNSSLKNVATTLNNKRIVKDKDGNLFKEERDTFKRMDLVERTVAAKGSDNNSRQLKTIMDTVAVTRIEKVRYVPLNTMELMALKKLSVGSSMQQPVPMANLRERTSSREEVSFVPLNNYKVASRRVDPGKFNQLIQNTSLGISNYFDGSRNFYAAFIAGGNASFGNPGAFGMQMGIAGLYSIGERLTLAAELKYVNHYFSNYTLQDESVTFENISSQQLTGADWLFSGTQQTTTAAYKVNSFSALEMPVTLSYNLGRVSVFAGLNMAYAFPVNWSKELTLNTSSVQQVRQTSQNPFVDAAFKLDEKKDFASRLGLGYVWGISYDLSRKVSIDARVGQILWDNNNGNTDALNRLFRIPTVQLSFGYFLGRKEKVIYIMDRR